MAIAFAIPYAGGSLDFLRRAIESVRAQTLAAWRLVVVDDSPEPAAEVAALVREYADARISYRPTLAPHGIAHGWNACLDATDAAFLTILHADDELEPTYANEMLALAERYPQAAQYFCNVTVIDAAGAPAFSAADAFKRLITPRGDDIVMCGPRAIGSLCIGNFIFAPTLMYRRAALGERRFDSQRRFVLDLAFTIDTLARGGSLAGTSARLLRYRRHGAQQTAVLARETARIDEENAFYRDLASRLEAAGAHEAARLARLRLSVRLSGLFGAVVDTKAGRYGHASAKLRRSLLS